MNDLVQAILSRRSVRTGFSTRPVSRDELESVVACGLAAPSSKNAQPWRLHVVQDRWRLDKIAQCIQHAKDAAQYVPHDPSTGQPRSEYRSSVAASADVLRRVPAAIVIENLAPFSNGRASVAAATATALPDVLVGYMFEIVGVGAAIENLWLAAHAHGLGAGFVGDAVIAEPDIRQELGMTGDLVGIFVLGHTTDAAIAPLDEPAFPESARAVWHD